MSVLEKIKFWKHEANEQELPQTPFPEQFHSPQPSPDPFSGSFQSDAKPPSFSDLSLGSNPQPLAQSQGPSRDFEMIHLKLDAIKNVLENVNLRLERLEHAAGVHDQRHR